jgi:hypothetical protein
MVDITRPTTTATTMTASSSTGRDTDREFVRIHCKLSVSSLSATLPLADGALLCVHDGMVRQTRSLWVTSTTVSGSTTSVMALACSPTLRNRRRARSPLESDTAHTACNQRGSASTAQPPILRRCPMLTFASRLPLPVSVGRHVRRSVEREREAGARLVSLPQRRQVRGPVVARASARLRHLHLQQQGPLRGPAR